jgi:glycolate oxidase FAD binding subunit
MPGSAERAAEALRATAAAGGGVRFVGGRTKLGWGSPLDDADLELSTAGLHRIVEHNAADLTAVLEAGVPLAQAQEAFAGAGQMLALDPPSLGGRATVGGVVATGDAGPLRHRYGGPRDLLLGIRVALPDGTLARAGGRVIKNVAGYDLAKLFAGAFGTLGLVVEVVVRLHPLPAARATAVGRTDDPDALQRAAIGVGDAPLELDALDIRWERGRGALLARVGGVEPLARAHRAASLMGEAGLDPAVTEDDERTWERQRALQRADAGVSVRVSAVRSDLARAVRASAATGATVVGRAGLGLLWFRLPAAPDEDLIAAVGELRSAMAPRPCVVLDAPEAVRRAIDVWGEAAALGLMRRVKARFDPSGACNPGVFVGGI